MIGVPVVAARRERAVLEPRADAWSLSCGNEVRPEMSWFVEIKNEADHARISPVKMVDPTKDRASQGGSPFRRAPTSTLQGFAVGRRTGDKVPRYARGLKDGSRIAFDDGRTASALRV